jgi:hypothetical protein
VATPAPEPANQRRLLVALAVVILILLLALALVAGLLLGKIGGTSTTATTTGTSPSPQAATSSSPSARSSPKAAEIGGAGSLLGPGPGSDPADGRGNGPGGQIWVDSGWTLGDCGLPPVNGDNAYQAIAYVTEHKAGAGGEQWRVFLMTTTSTDSFWHTKLYYSDESGGGFTNITVKAVDTTGGGRPDLMVGFRHNKTSGGGTVLDYDVIMRASAPAPLAIVMHRQIADGSVVIAGGHVNDYESGPTGQYTKSDITFSGGLFHLAGTSQVAKAAVPASLLP